MAATISVAFASNITVTSTLTGFVAPNDDTWTINGLDESGTYTASTTVPVTKATAYTLTMSAGSGAIDLTALPGINTNQTLDMTGLKVQFLKFIAPATNANPVTVTKAVSNGYGLNAAGTSWTEVIDPGQSRTYSLNDTAPDVGSGAKAITVTGTGSQTLQIEVVAG